MKIKQVFKINYLSHNPSEFLLKSNWNARKSYLRLADIKVIQQVGKKKCFFNNYLNTKSPQTISKQKIPIKTIFTTLFIKVRSTKLIESKTEWT